MGELKGGRNCTLSKQHLPSKVLESDLEGAVEELCILRVSDSCRYEMAGCLLPGSGEESWAPFFPSGPSPLAEHLCSPSRMSPAL